MPCNQKTYFKRSSLFLALTSALYFPGSAMANDEAVAEEDVERISVTGSRISRDPNVAAPSPVTSVSAEDIQTSGEFSITDVVNDIPSLFSSTTSENSRDSGFADGTNILSLRGLGSKRTLVLVNGKRHVGGTQGSGAVDVGSIPVGLIESVEVLTGGASAVYGADAVTGVVNFILKEDFEGLKFDAQVGTSVEGGGTQSSFDLTYGVNFDDDRGNFAFNVAYAKDEGLSVSDRDNGLFIGTGADLANPALRFQIGDITDGATPNLSRYYSIDNELVNYGIPIPSQADFITTYTDTYGSAPTLTDAEIALFDRAANAPARAVHPGRTFPITSGYGMLLPGNAFNWGLADGQTAGDLNSNGVPDCYESFTGWNGTANWGGGAFGYAGGCWVADSAGNWRPVTDGLVAGNFDGFGGDSFNTIQQDWGWLISPEEKISLNLLSTYDVTDEIQVKAELKYVKQEVEDISNPTSFWDLLYGAPDNPYLPDFAKPLATAYDGVSITIDPLAMGRGAQLSERETIRAVLSANGYLENDWEWDVSAVYGKFTRKASQEDAVINDRFLAAIDAVTDPDTGNVVCRSTLDTDAPIYSTPFGIPPFDDGYYSFTPGDGTCVPLNIWNGAAGVTQEALDWVTITERDEITIEQTVLSATLAGEFSDDFELPGGVIAFAVGGEYREETSDAWFDPWQNGVLPAGSPFGAGTNIDEVSTNSKLTFRPNIAVRNESGSYDVTELFFEVSLPLLADMPLAHNLTLDLAGRYSDYSTIGETTTWRANVLYSPIEDLMVRYSFSKAVRAPNINELFGPQVGTTFRPTDVCSAEYIAAQDASISANLEANCTADLQSIGLNPYDADGNYVYADPLSASFGGVTSGNPDLGEESADTTTIGFVFTPTWLEGFTLSVDYFDISIEDAINSVSAQNIVNGCYYGSELNDAFCSLFTRNTDSSSAQFGGFTFLRTAPVNFAKRETSGYDFAVSYDFEVGSNEFNVKFNGTKVDELNDFTNPLDLTEVDEELGEIFRPEWAGNIFLNWTVGDLTVGWQSQFMDKQLVAGVERSDVYSDDPNFVPVYDLENVEMDAFWQHDINATYQLDDQVMIYGGIKNLTDEEPFVTEYAYPASPRGQYVYLGVSYKM